VLAAAVATGKPVVACFVGGSSIAPRPGVAPAATLEDAAHLAVGSPLPLGEGQGEGRSASWISSIEQPSPYPLPEGEERPARGSGERRHVRGLFAGGTFAYEAAWLLSQSLGNVAHVEHGEPADLTGHAVVDLGADAFTVGRAHPMIDPRLRADWIAATARDPRVGVLLLDVVLGYGAHPDPAGALLPSLAEARSAGIALVASVCGTVADPQRLPDQEAKLRNAGVAVAPSSSAAARLAAQLAGAPT
jgi:FdrA protein